MTQPIKQFLFVVIMAAAFAACNKTEDIIVDNNVPPPDHTIDSSTMQIYVNKAYINILGREPLAWEKTSGINQLTDNNFSLANRIGFIQTVIGKSDYVRNQYDVARVEYLQNLDSLEIEQQIYQYEYFLTQPQYAPFYDIINAELARIEPLKTIVYDFQNGIIDRRGMLRRCVDNYFYDQINMGSENFVVSTFQNFLFRYPTTSELTAGKAMVDGGVSSIFLESGKNKADYINIFFNTDDYYEGQVRYMFKKYLFREPSSAEINYYAGIYKNGTYHDLEVAFFTLEEYAGIE